MSNPTKGQKRQENSKDEKIDNAAQNREQSQIQTKQTKTITDIATEAPPWSGCSETLYPYVAHDCQDIKDLGFKDSGVYHVTPPGTFSGFYAYCDMTTDGGGWLVFQRRLDGSVDFYRDWENYQFGFGNVSSEFWLGNYPLHIILAQSHYKLRIDLADWDGNNRHAVYQVFKLGDVTDSYRLFISGYSGDAEDSLSHHSGYVFSTHDRDSTGYGRGCATEFGGAWWYAQCHLSNLNGVYNSTVYANGVTWRGWHGQHYSLRSSEMKIRRI